MFYSTQSLLLATFVFISPFCVTLFFINVTQENTLPHLKTKRSWRPQGNWRIRVKEGRQTRAFSMREDPWAIQTNSSYNHRPAFLIQLTSIRTLSLLLPHLTMPEVKIAQGEVKVVWELQGGGSMQCSQRVNIFPDIPAPLFERQKGDGVRDEEWTRLCDCSDAWVAISAFSASTSPEGRGGGCGVGRELKETRGRGLQDGRVGSVKEKAASHNYYSITFVETGNKTTLEGV